MSGVEARMRKLVRDSRLTPLQLSRKSGVSFHKIRRWVLIPKREMKITDADAIHRSLTGVSLVPTPVKKKSTR